MLRAPELDAGLPGGSHQCGAKRQHPLPRPVTHAAEDAAQGMVGLLGCERTLLDHVKLLVNEHPQVLLRRSTPNPFPPQPLLLPAFAPTQVQN